MRQGQRDRNTESLPAVQAEAEPDEDIEFALPERALKPGQCRTYMRKTLAAQFPYILRGLVMGARRGSCQHVKLATELLQSTEARGGRQRGTVEKLLDEWGVE